MRIETIDGILKYAIGTGQYIKYPSFDIRNRDYHLAVRLNDDEMNKDLCKLLNKIAKGRKLDDIDGQKMRYRVKDEWFPFYTLSTVERLFLISYAATAFKRNVVLHYGFSQMKPKTFRTYINTFNESGYITLIVERDDKLKIQEMLTDNKLLIDNIYTELGEKTERCDVEEKLAELVKEPVLDNMRDKYLFKDFDFSSERMNIIKQVTWSEGVHSTLNGCLVYDKPLNLPSYELRQIFDLISRKADYLILSEPDVMLSSFERRIFYEYLCRADVTYKGIYLSDYQ